MGKHRRTSDDAPRQPATGDSGATYWSVDDADWPAVRPTLPAEMVDLLAPPIVVGVARVVATSRMSPPADAPVPTAATRPPGPVRSGTSAARPTAPGATTVRFAASTGPSRPAGPVPGGAPSPGRHRPARTPSDRT